MHTSNEDPIDAFYKKKTIRNADLLYQLFLTNLAMCSKVTYTLDFLNTS